MKRNKQNNQKRQPRYGDPNLLTKHELADELQISYSAVDAWTRQGRIPAIFHPLGPGHGRQVFYCLAAVRRSLKTLNRPRTPPPRRR